MAGSRRRDVRLVSKPNLFPFLVEYTERRAHEEAGLPKGVPWSFVEPHEDQALSNHEQTLDRLAQRGGLGADELLAVVTGQDWRTFHHTPFSEIAAELLRLLQAHTTEAELPR